MNTTSVRTGALAVGDISVLVVVRPAWGAVLSGVAAPRAWLAAGPDAAVADVCGVLLWLAAAWIGLGLLAGLGARLPGAAGRQCARCARVVVPRVLLRLVLGSTGLGLLAAPAAQAVTPASISVRPAVTASWSASAVPSPVWPVGPAPSSRSLPAPTPPTTSTPTTTPTTTTPPAPPSSTPTVPKPARPSSTRAPASTARVHPGDSLWLLAARRLGAHADPDDVARYWPQVYAANRGVLGDDPSVIHPGQVLDLPAPTTQESS